jgi:hypothetical protein
MRWPHTGGDPSRPGHCPRRTGHSLIRSERLPRCLLHPSNLARVQMRRPHPVGVISTLQLRAAIKSHSACCTASAKLPATSCLGAFWTPAATACGTLRHAGIQKPCMGLWKSSREFTACDFFLQLNFFVRLESPFLRPDPQCPNAVARRVCQGWPSLRYLLMLSAMPGQTLTNPSTAARSLWSGWTGRGELACRARTFVPQPCIRWGRNDPGP